MRNDLRNGVMNLWLALRASVGHPSSMTQRLAFACTFLFGLVAGCSGGGTTPTLSECPGPACPCTGTNCACQAGATCMSDTCLDSCNFDCGAGSTCDVDCGGSCDTDCAASSDCNITAEESSNVECEAGSTCTVTVGASSNVDCRDGAVCDVTCTASCNVECLGATCTLRCAGAAPQTVNDASASCDGP